MHKSTLLLPITLGAALLLSACGPADNDSADNGSGGSGSGETPNVAPSSPANATLSIEAIKTDNNDTFGISVSLSINGDQSNNDTSSAGAMYLY